MSCQVTGFRSLDNIFVHWQKKYVICSTVRLFHKYVNSCLHFFDCLPPTKEASTQSTSQSLSTSTLPHNTNRLKQLSYWSWTGQRMKDAVDAVQERGNIDNHALVRMFGHELLCWLFGAWDVLRVPPITLWGRGGVVVSALDFRSEGRWFKAQSLISCCFLRQETLSHIVSLHPGV